MKTEQITTKSMRSASIRCGSVSVSVSDSDSDSDSDFISARCPAEQYQCNGFRSDNDFGEMAAAAS